MLDIFFAVANDKVTIISNIIPLNFESFFNKSDFSDTVVEVRKESGEIVSTLKAHKIILCQNSICNKILEENEIVSIKCSSADAAETFIKYLYTHKVEKIKLTPDLMKIAKTFEDQFLQEACRNNVLKNLKKLTLTELINQFLLLKNEDNYVLTFLAKHFAKNYSKFKVHEDFSKILADTHATKLILDAYESIHAQMVRRMNVQKLNFTLKLSWAKKAVYEFKVPSGTWTFNVYRAQSDNEDWMYLNYEKVNSNSLVPLLIQDFFVKLLPHSDRVGAFPTVSEKTCEVNKHSSATRFLRWAYVMDPENGYSKNGEIKVELEFTLPEFIPKFTFPKCITKPIGK